MSNYMQFIPTAKLPSRPTSSLICTYIIICVADPINVASSTARLPLGSQTLTALEVQRLVDIASCVEAHDKSRPGTPRTGTPENDGPLRDPFTGNLVAESEAQEPSDGKKHITDSC